MPYVLAQAVDQAFWSALGANGPWAVVAGLLLAVILNEWRTDRREVKPFFMSLTSALNEIKSVIVANTAAQDRASLTSERILETQEKILDHLRRGRGAGES